MLRLAATELSIAETPPRVVLQESIRLAERYCTPQHDRFVYCELDELASLMGRL